MKHTKPLLCTLLAAVLLACFITGASAAVPPGMREIPVTTDRGAKISGCLVDSATYVPLYIFAEASGGCVYGWDFSARAAYASSDGLYVTATPGDMFITANGRCFFGKVLDFDGTVYVPVRSIASAFGYEVVWNGAAYSVALHGSGQDYCASATEVYDSDDLYWLSRIIYAESGGEPFLGQIAVGNVVLNRVASPSYPDSVYGVVFDRKYGTQFTPAATGSIYRTPSAKSVAAAKICLEGYSLSDTMLFFLNPRIASNFWIVRACVPVMSIGNHDFYG